MVSMGSGGLDRNKQLSTILQRQTQLTRSLIPLVQEKISGMESLPSLLRLGRQCKDKFGTLIRKKFVRNIGQIFNDQCGFRQDLVRTDCVVNVKCIDKKFTSVLQKTKV